MATADDKEVARLNQGGNEGGNATKKGLTCALICAVIAGSVGSGFQHGYNTGVINSPEKFITSWIKDVMRDNGQNPTPGSVTIIWSIVVSIFCVGGMIGGLSSGAFAGCFGLKGGLLVNNVFAIAAGLLQGFAKSANSYYMLIAGRLIIGLNSGINTGISPLYLVDISPRQLRGAMGSVYQLVLTISILISQIISLKIFLGTEELWPILFFVTIGPALFQVITLPFCPESPRYLEEHGKEEKAEKALVCLRNSTDVQDEIDEMKAEFEAARQEPNVTLKEMFGNRMLRIKITITVTVMIAQQLSGINAIMYFSTNIFMNAGLTSDEAQIATILMGFMNVLMTFISVILVEMCGRKTLLLIGFGGMFIITCLLTFALAMASSSQVFSYMCVVFVILFVVLFAVGPGSIPWFLVGELFNSNAKPLATSISVGVNWTANFIVGLGFLPLKDLMSGYVFVIFAVLQLLFFLFILWKVPETKNKSIEEINAELRHSEYE